jgi:peptidoglycan/xylan/chitin deacetylase (PgdA/CDA1 family)
MDWAELAAVAEDPLVTIGAHTRSHPILSKWAEEVVVEELDGSRREIAERLGRAPRHLAYPIGNSGAVGPREFAIAERLGFASAWTTEPGTLFPSHLKALTSLPRVSLNGHFQRERHLDVLLSGLPFALLNGLRRMRGARAPA